MKEVQGGTDAVSVIEKAIEDSTVYHFGELLDLPQVQQLAGGPNAAHLEALKIFAYGTLNDFSASANPIALNPAQKRKLQYLTLVSLCGASKAVKYDVLRQELGVASVRELEDLVIDAMYEDLVQGKLCQLEETLEIHSAVGRDVRDEDIDTMLTILTSWNERSQGISQSIEDNIQGAQKAHHMKQVAAEEEEKKKETVKEAVLASQKNGGGDKTSGGMMGMLGSAANFVGGGRSSKMKGRR